MARYVTDVELRQRDGSFKTISSAELLPGDFIKIIENQSLPCDLIAMSGISIVNEALLTGESIPVMK